MEQTLGTFKMQQSQALQVLKKLHAFLQQGRGLGVAIEPALMHKLETAMASVEGDKLKVALIGGFSEGKTSIAAAWMERLDQSTMKISHQESSNEVKIYEVGSDFVLIDTPGLFGFKEQMNADTCSIEKYKDITKKYVSEAHLVLYVMNSTNPVKESHQDDLQWLFRTLNLLPRTVFVLSRFDEVADVEDEGEHRRNLEVKRDNVSGRLVDLIGLTPDEAADLAVVGVAANPFDLGTDYWLSNLEKFKALSHIASLQLATTQKIKANGGAAAIVDEAQKSVIRDVLGKQLKIAEENDESIAAEVDKLSTVSARLQSQLNATNGQIADVKISLREFVSAYFSDLILQAGGATMETFGDFFEREVGDGGVVVATRLQNEFERQMSAVTLEVSKMKIGFEAEINHFNATVRKYGKQGVEYVISSKLINNTTVLAARDGVVTAAKFIGMDLAKMLKFKPWGAANLAKGINGALVVFGLALEAWDSWEQAKRQQAFREAVKKMVSNFETQRKELLELINSTQFAEQFFPDYVELRTSVNEVKDTVARRSEQRQCFHAWRQAGEAIEIEFSSQVASSPG